MINFWNKLKELPISVIVALVWLWWFVAFIVLAIYSPVGAVVITLTLGSIATMVILILYFLSQIAEK